ncbi:MAG TPA: hypothetical protein VKC66_32505 [Xanthobacteraceae bacterium]|nr:hypothetical protein [Xanthobacteraceae bacterium]
MRRIILPLAALALCATASYAVLPRAHDSYALLVAQDEPAMLADIAVDKALSAPVARSEIENALNADDAELAASFLELARDRGIAVDPQLAARVDAANAASARVVHAAVSFGHGLVTGTPEDVAGLAGTATGDLLVIGDIRDAVREGAHLARGEETDELILGLACAGILVTAGTYASAGMAAPARVGLSVVKAAEKTGRLAAPVVKWMTRSIREAVDTKAFGTALSKASITAPSEALRLARDAVKLDRAEGIITMMRDVGRVRSKAGTRAALEGLKLSEGPGDVARLARLAETKGGKTRAILRLVGRAALTLTVAVIDLLSWVFTAFCAVFGFCSAVKRTTERSTERYLHWRKRRRARRLGAATAQESAVMVAPN